MGKGPKKHGAMPNSCLDLCRSELAESCSPEALVHDAVTKMFWKNVKARATGQAAGLSTATLTLPAGQVGAAPGSVFARALPS